MKRAAFITESSHSGVRHDESFENLKPEYLFFSCLELGLTPLSPLLCSFQIIKNGCFFNTNSGSLGYGEHIAKHSVRPRIAAKLVSKTSIPDFNLTDSKDDHTLSRNFCDKELEQRGMLSKYAFIPPPNNFYGFLCKYKNNI